MEFIPTQPIKIAVQEKVRDKSWQNLILGYYLSSFRRNMTFQISVTRFNYMEMQLIVISLRSYQLIFLRHFQLQGYFKYYNCQDHFHFILSDTKPLHRSVVTPAGINQPFAVSHVISFLEKFILKLLEISFVIVVTCRNNKNNVIGPTGLSNTTTGGTQQRYSCACS